MKKYLCGVYYNKEGFKIGKKYIYIIRAYTGKVLDRIGITPQIEKEIESICKEYSQFDVNRTVKVIESLREVA